ncbi:hypothetical protein, partial [Azospirillum sp. B506]|uniref:hypothetical protein n=1 Tax=Azospirillum sp. B506 TaxID=137721 RepID=UPI0018FF1B0F
KNQKKPDGIIFRFDGEEIHLEIVEMKSKLNKKSWDSTKEQAEAGLLNALAIKGIFDLPNFSSITLHVAYKIDNLSIDRSSSPSLFRVPLGEKITKPSWMDWEDGNINLLASKNISINKIVRDENGDCSCVIKNSF